MKKKKMIKCILVLGLSAVLTVSTLAAQQEELESENDEYESLIDEQEEELESLQNEIEKAENYIEELEEKIAEAEEDLESIEKELENTQDEINTLTKEVAEEEAEIAELYATMSLRIQYFYENSHSEILLELLEADSFADFLTSVELSLELTEYDREQIDKVYSIIENVELQKDALEEEYAQLEILKETQEDQTAQLEVLKAEQEEYLTAAYSEEYELEETIEALKAEYEKNAVAISAIIDGYDEDTVADLTSMIWPLPTEYGESRITSYFGYRSSSSTNGVGSTNHKGIDISAPKGTEIYAVLDGTVVMSGYHSSCGYYVIIYHGGGLYSHYYHQCKASPLSVGDEVNQGDVIGYVGTTGASTGYHLHFGLTTEDIWEGYIDPLPYLQIALSNL